MTPEERFTKIESALNHAAEIRAEHSEDIRELRRMQKGVVIVIGKLAQSQKRSEENFEKRLEASATEFDRKFDALIQAQMETERELQRWIRRERNGGKNK